MLALNHSLRTSQFNWEPKEDGPDGHSVCVVAPLVEADKEVDEQQYLLWRLKKGVPEGSTEIPKGLAGFSVNKSVIRTCIVGLIALSIIICLGD
ncbi:hypothetical protein BHE74_00045968 [Ensete ventricosum]|nr:hypothetical protein BHE74_00045968 [Ensete ventricosum]